MRHYKGIAIMVCAVACLTVRAASATDITSGFPAEVLGLDPAAVFVAEAGASLHGDTVPGEIGFFVWLDEESDRFIVAAVQDFLDAQSSRAQLDGIESVGFAPLPDVEAAYSATSFDSTGRGVVHVDRAGPGDELC